MYMVYWTMAEGDAKTPHAREFDSADMSGAMAFMETLRARQRTGESVCFITMASENPHAVGHPGVAEAGPDYAWKKRRR
ncbi:hypothetical protein D3870_18105 [Noviherbaspirillum cavernae]|uniref:Uncharacterized protein n=1 Tax=Noviherbaspirillum cavernae TaxID=2320862 RepID=A0A418X590_9BURK|nr:hypothetical protein [Noviherbaspirillum cavernae]RJG07654.1 hypothetical protein D3870_18105 [Noviherbaspirillum cavernae]